MKLSALAGVAALYLLSGALSPQLQLQGNFRNLAGLVGIPFALLSTILLVRGYKAALVFPLIALTYPAAQFIATAVHLTTGADYSSMGIAGAVGALFVTLSASIACRNLRPVPHLLGSLAVGYFGGLAFGPWLVSDTAHMNTTDFFQPTRLRYAFAVWQGGVGTYLYAVSKGLL